MIIKSIAKTVAALNSNSKPQAVSAAIAWAFLLALIPLNNLLWPVLFILTLFFRLNMGFEIVFILVFKALALLLYPLTESFGWWLLNKQSITTFIYTLQNTPIIFYLKLHNSTVLGGLIMGLLSWFPLFFLSKTLVVIFRNKISPAIARSKVVNSLKKMPIVNLFIKALSQYSKIYK